VEEEIMGFRIGRKVGNYYISTGKSGTRISRKFGDYYVSHFSPNKRGKTKTKQSKEAEEIGYIASDDENSATVKTIWWNVLISILFVLFVWLTSQLWITLGLIFVLQVVGSYRIWKNVETETRWIMWFFPIIVPFVMPLSIIYILSVFGAALWLM
jgi:hypothetical protein